MAAEDETGTGAGPSRGAALASTYRLQLRTPASDPDGRGFTLADAEELVPYLADLGVGAVYLSHHDLLDQPVAVKLMTAQSLDSASVVERFLREARALATTSSTPPPSRPNSAGSTHCAPFARHAGPTGWAWWWTSSRTTSAWTSRPPTRGGGTR